MKLTDENGKEYEIMCKTEFFNAGDGYSIIREIKPEPKLIDMSVCIESGIDCEFVGNDANKDEESFGKLQEYTTVGNTPEYKRINGGYYYACRPRMNGHIHASPDGWNKCPIPEGFVVKYWFIRSDMLKSSTTSTPECPEIQTDWSNVNMFEVVAVHEDYML